MSTHSAEDRLGRGEVGTEDKDLAIAFKNGELGAYDAIYGRYSDRVNGVCRRMLGQPEDAKEASQEVFLRVYQALPRFNGRYQLGAWITRIATNVCLDQIRGRNRKPSDAFPDELLELTPAPVDESDPEALFMRHSEGRRVRKVLSQLPPMHRAAIVLRDFEGLSYEEVAIALGISDTQVKALLHRARKGFRRSWQEVAAMLIPARWLQRLRGAEESARDHATQVMTPATQMATSCSSLLQQCGQFVTERTAALVTATAATVVVGSAAVGGLPAAPSSSDVPNEGAQVAASSQEPMERAPMDAPTKSVRRVQTSAQDETAPAEAPPAAPLPSPTEPAPQQTEEPPATEPSPEPEDNGSSDPGKPAPDPEPSQPVAVIPVTPPAIGFDRGGPVAASVPTSDQTAVQCESLSINQNLATMIGDGAASYPGSVSLNGSSTLGLQLSLTKDGKTIEYQGGGVLTERSTSDHYLFLTYRGSYGTSSSSSAAAGLPQSGRFVANLTLDCAASSVVTESLTLAT